MPTGPGLTAIELYGAGLAREGGDTGSDAPRETTASGTDLNGERTYVLTVLQGNLTP